MAIYSGFAHKQMVFFHSYVNLPEGNIYMRRDGLKPQQQQIWHWKQLIVSLPAFATPCRTTLQHLGRNKLY